MIALDTTYLILFAANLAFIVTHLYSWLLKWFYKPQAYREHFHEFFPAQRSVGYNSNYNSQAQENWHEDNTFGSSW
jgi:hypothetical protein